MKQLALLALVCIAAYLALASMAMSPAPRQDAAYTVMWQGSATVTGAPSISANFINQVLCKFSSPACGKGQALYSYGVKYHIDPVYALAFFLHESSFGRAGVARFSKSLGNLRCIPGAACIGGYAYFSSWEQGFAAWYALISGPLYVGSGLVTVEQIIPRYAPAEDNNVPAQYIATVKAVVASWRAGKAVLS
jgi:hypothetical protein